MPGRGSWEQASANHPGCINDQMLVLRVSSRADSSPHDLLSSSPRDSLASLQNMEPGLSTLPLSIWKLPTSSWSHRRSAESSCLRVSNRLQVVQLPGCTPAAGPCGSDVLSKELLRGLHLAELVPELRQVMPGSLALLPVPSLLLIVDGDQVSTSS